MNIIVSDFLSPALCPFETVERKGIGHPDTMADLAAELFIISYAHEAECMGSGLPNIWVDKTAINGACVEVDFDHLHVISPIQLNFIGKFAERIGPNPFDFELLGKTIAEKLVKTCLRDDTALDHILTSIINTAGTAVDRPNQFYRPDTPFPPMLACELSNDTIVATGYAPLTPIERLTLDVERFMTSANGDLDTEYYGTDVKVQCLRINDKVVITACLPVRPFKCSSASDYQDAISDAQKIIEKFVQIQFERPALSGLKPSLILNSKDTNSNFYLAPFGSSLGKGDCGVVGRGNRWEGVISNRRPISMEAPCGKNPRHHGGKLLTAAAHSIAVAIHEQLGIPSQVVLACSNGQPLASPSLVSIELDTHNVTPRLQGAASRIAKAQLERLAELSQVLSTYDPVWAVTVGHPPRLS